MRLRIAAAEYNYQGRGRWLKDQDIHGENDASRDIIHECTATRHTSTVTSDQILQWAGQVETHRI